MGLTKYNVSLDAGFKKEDETLSGMSANARTTLEKILMISNGDLTETAKILDSILGETQMKIKKLTEQEDLGDEEFYRRLCLLRSEHKDTLDIIERLYMKSTRSIYSSINNNEKATQSDEFWEKSPEVINEASITCGENGNKYSVIDEAAKSHKELSKIQPTEEIEKQALFEEKYYISPSKYVDRNEKHSLSEPESISLKYIQPLDLTKLNEDHSNDDLKSVDSSTWRHHITIPKPFKMCEREEKKKQTDARTQSMRNPKNIIEDKEQELTKLRTSAKQFRAKPIPAHVYLPLFEKLMEEQAARREAVRAYSKEVLKATEKPFQFTIRERMKKEREGLGCKAELARRSASLTRQRSAAGKQKSANDVYCDTLDLPNHLYENRMERMHEDQLLREVKRQLRAQRLLQSASLPTGMEERERRAAQRRADRQAREKQLGLDPNSEMEERAAKPFRAKPAPDFKQIHWKTDKSLRRLWKPPPEPTRPKPFNLHSNRRSNSLSATQSRNRSAASGLDEAGLDGKKSPDVKKITPRSRDFRRSLADIPAPAKAHASMLRENYIRQSMEKARLEAKKAEELEMARRSKQSELSRLMRDSACHLGDQAVSPKQLVTAVTESRTRELMQQDSARQAEYRRELEEMRKRVASRPLLITRQSQVVARQRAENKFADSLRQAGLDPQAVIETVNESVSNRNHTKPHAGDRYEKYDPSNHFGSTENLGSP